LDEVQNKVKERITSIPVERIEDELRHVFHDGHHGRALRKARR